MPVARPARVPFRSPLPCGRSVRRSAREVAVRVLLPAGALWAGLPGPARADVTVHTSQSRFEAAAGHLASHGFTGPEGSKANPYTVGLLSFASASKPYGVLHTAGGYGRGVMFYSPDSGGTVKVAGGTRAISFVLGTYYRADTISISVDGGRQVQVATGGGRPVTSFIGLTSDTPMNRLSFSITGSELDFIRFQVGAADAPLPPPPR